MRQKELLLATLMMTLLGGVTLAQTSREDALDAIRRGNEKYAKSEYEPAIREYRRVPLSAGESYATSLYNIGVCYYELWMTEEAIVYYRRAVEARKGRYPMALHALGGAQRSGTARGRERSLQAINRHLGWKLRAGSLHVGSARYERSRS